MPQPQPLQTGDSRTLSSSLASEMHGGSTIPGGESILKRHGASSERTMTDFGGQGVIDRPFAEMLKNAASQMSLPSSSIPPNVPEQADRRFTLKPKRTQSEDLAVFQKGSTHSGLHVSPSHTNVTSTRTHSSMKQATKSFSGIPSYVSPAASLGLDTGPKQPKHSILRKRRSAESVRIEASDASRNLQADTTDTGSLQTSFGGYNAVRRAHSWPGEGYRIGALDDLLNEEDVDEVDDMTVAETIYEVQEFSMKDTESSKHTEKSDKNERKASRNTKMSTYSKRGVSDSTLVVKDREKKRANNPQRGKLTTKVSLYGFFGMLKKGFSRGLSYGSSLGTSLIRRKVVKKGSSGTSMSSLLSIYLEKMSAVITFSEFAVSIFKESGEPITMSGVFLLELLVLALAAVVSALLSDVAGIGFDIYYLLICLDPFATPFILSAASLAIVFHLIELHRCKVNLCCKITPVVMVLLLLFAGCLAFTKTYAEIPLIFACLQFPLILGLARFFTAGRVNAISFQSSAAFCCAFTGCVMLAAWITWIEASGKHWNSETRASLQEAMTSIHEEYALLDWAHCETLRHQRKASGQKLLDDCANVELVAFLVWLCPLVESVVLLVIAMCLWMRLWIVSHSAEAEMDAVPLKLVFFIFVLVGVIWTGCSTAGSSMGLSSTILLCLGSIAVVTAIWLFFTIRAEDLLRQVEKSLLWLLISPLFYSDWLKAFGFCLSCSAVACFFVLEILRHQVKRVLAYLNCSESTPSEICNRWMSGRGARLWSYLSDWHWPRVLERSWIWCLVFLAVWIIFSKCTIVFLSWLNRVLEGMNFGVVSGAYYVVGFLMFLLPPMTGIVVYCGAGAILVPRAVHEPWMSFTVGVIYASVLSLFLKLNAAVVTHKCFGRSMGKMSSVLKMVQVHNIGTKAMERILVQPGFGIGKVLILCGGPDWPVCVVCGILNIKVHQMLLGVLPCIFLIIPCVLAGACLSDEKLAAIGPMTIMLMGFLQGSVFVAALIFTSREATKTFTKSGSRDLRAVTKGVQAAQASRMQADPSHRKSSKYDEFGMWGNLTCLEKSCLPTAVVFELTACWVSSLLASLCFRPFSLAKRIDESYEEGGLDGNALNLLLPLGQVVCGLLVAGIILFVIYYMSKQRRWRRLREEFGGEIDDQISWSSGTIGDMASGNYPPCSPSPDPSGHDAMQTSLKSDPLRLSDATIGSSAKVKSDTSSYATEGLVPKVSLGEAPKVSFPRAQSTEIGTVSATLHGSFAVAEGLCTCLSPSLVLRAQAHCTRCGGLVRSSNGERWLGDTSHSGDSHQSSVSHTPLKDLSPHTPRSPICHAAAASPRVNWSPMVKKPIFQPPVPPLPD